jgi:hypothetical protein
MRKLRTLSVAREVALAYRTSGDLEALVRDCCLWGWHFGRFREYNRELFARFLCAELREVSQ